MTETKFLSCFLCCFLFFIITEASIASNSLQAIDEGDKNEYRAAIPHSDKHKFGYELGESRVFHHTTTDEDGVRLGCYGHVLEGKKYSTQYVADMKGYRIVPTLDLITVFPKSGGERQASFFRQFGEDEIRSRNIRFFFPDGCQSKQDLEPAPSVQVPVYILPPPVTKAATTTTTTSTTTQKPRPRCRCTCDEEVELSCSQD